MKFILMDETEVENLVRRTAAATVEAMQKSATAAAVGGNSPFLTKKEAADLLSCCTGTIDSWARAGRLNRHYFGKNVRFERAQLLALAR